MECKIRTSLLFACIVVLANGAPPQKIVGGTNVKLGDYPYVVSIHKDEQHYCGGAIISNQHILTAAHCMQKIQAPIELSRMTVVTGTVSLYEGGQTHKIWRFVIHDGYFSSSDISRSNDVAILTLAAPINFNQYQNKIELASTDFADKSRAVVAGWGYMSSFNKQISTILKKVNAYVVHYDICEQFVKTRLNPRQICSFHAPGEDTCNGDSGGPLTLNNEIIGIVSWGSKICASGMPDVYTNVFYFRDYIQNEISLKPPQRNFYY